MADAWQCLLTFWSWWHVLGLSKGADNSEVEISEPLRLTTNNVQVGSAVYDFIAALNNSQSYDIRSFAASQTSLFLFLSQ